MTQDKYRMTEAQLVDKIIHYLHMRGWVVTHFRPAKLGTRWITALSGDKGFPDICAARNGEVWFIEAKIKGGRLSAEQRIWGKHLPADRYLVIYPDDFIALVERMR